jgi:hypothetical protein
VLTLAGTKIPYTDVSENELRFALKLTGKSPALEYDLELPAGSLNCAPPGTPANTREGRVVGFCVTAGLAMHVVLAALGGNQSAKCGPIWSS